MAGGRIVNGIDHALVQAIRALVEQQRIANLQHESYRLREKARGRTDRDAGVLLEQADRIDAEIREALGLS